MRWALFGHPEMARVAGRITSIDISSGVLAAADATLLRLHRLLDQQLLDEGVLPSEFLLVIAWRMRDPS